MSITDQFAKAEGIRASNHDELQQKMRECGYDGVVQYATDGSISIAVTFDSNQIKSATDNRGTFDRSNPDIRYSISPVAGQAGATELPGQDLIDKLPKKAADSLLREERQMVNKLGRSLNVPYFAKREFLRPITREITLQYLKEGQVDQAAIDTLFHAAYENGIIDDREFYDQYKHIKDYLKRTKITISDADQSSIPDFEAFKKEANKFSGLLSSCFSCFVLL